MKQKIPIQLFDNCCTHKKAVKFSSFPSAVLIESVVNYFPIETQAEIPEMNISKPTFLLKACETSESFTCRKQWQSHRGVGGEYCAHPCTFPK